MESQVPATDCRSLSNRIDTGDIVHRTATPGLGRTSTLPHRRSSGAKNRWKPDWLLWKVQGWAWSRGSSDPLQIRYEVMIVFVPIDPLDGKRDIVTALLDPKKMFRGLPCKVKIIDTGAGKTL